MTTGTERTDDDVVRWLLDGDPAVRWQVRRDLLEAPPDQVSAERSRVATDGLGAALLALQADDGSWGGVAWNRGWDSTMHVLMLLRDLGLDPDGEPARRRWTASTPAWSGRVGAGRWRQPVLRR